MSGAPVRPSQPPRNIDPTSPASEPASPVSLPEEDCFDWIARAIVPHERAVRSWLGTVPLHGVTRDDIIQECYARLCTAKPRDIQDGRAFFFRCARNLVIEHGRRAKLYTLIQPVHDMEEQLADASPDPEQVYASRKKLDWLKQKLNDMPQPYRNTFILRKLYDCDQDDIATRLGISRRSVERHIATGLAYLLKARSDDS